MKVLGCIAHYGFAAALTFLLGLLLGSNPLFTEATLGATSLTAAHIMQFVAYTTSLVMLWMMGHRLATRLPKNGKWLACLRPIMIPLATLVVIMGAYTVIPLVGGPVLQKTGMGFYNWVFIVATAGTAVWLTLAWVVQSGTVIDSLAGGRRATR